MLIHIVDYGMGNLRSVHNAVRFLGYDVRIVDDADTVAAADVVVLPGVGAFGQAMENIRRLGLYDVLDEHVQSKGRPLFGICLGMQLAARSSSERGTHAGFGWIDGDVVSLADRGASLRVPHVGWNILRTVTPSPLTEDIQSTTSFYFDHSFELQCDARHTAAVCDYGGDLVAAIRKDNLFATQFHPEKSQSSGLRLLRRFFDAVGAPRPRSDRRTARC